MEDITKKEKKLIKKLSKSFANKVAKFIEEIGVENLEGEWENDVDVEIVITNPYLQWLADRTLDKQE